MDAPWDWLICREIVSSSESEKRINNKYWNILTTAEDSPRTSFFLDWKIWIERLVRWFSQLPRECHNGDELHHTYEPQKFHLTEFFFSFFMLLIRIICCNTLIVHPRIYHMLTWILCKDSREGSSRLPCWFEFYWRQKIIQTLPGAISNKFYFTFTRVLCIFLQKWSMSFATKLLNNWIWD